MLELAFSLKKRSLTAPFFYLFLLWENQLNSELILGYLRQSSLAQSLLALYVAG